MQAATQQEFEALSGELAWATLSVVENLREFDKELQRKLDISDDSDALALRALIYYGINKVGRGLLDTTSRREFGRLLDNLATGPEIWSWSQLMFKCVDNTTAPPNALVGTTFARRAAEVLTPGARDLLSTTATLMTAWYRASIHAAHYVDELPSDEVVREFPGPSILTDMTTPPQLAIGVLGGLQANCCLLAFSLAMDEGCPLEDWLGTVLVQRLSRGIQDHLRLLAALPGSNVPISLVPESERLDLEKLFRDNDRALRLLKRDQRLAAQQ